MTLLEMINGWFRIKPTVYRVNSISDYQNFDKTNVTRTYRGHNIYIFGGDYTENIYSGYVAGHVTGWKSYGYGFYVISLDAEGMYDELYWVPNRQWKMSEEFRKEGIQKAVTMTEKYIDNQIAWLDSMRKKETDKKACETALINQFRSQAGE